MAAPSLHKPVSRSLVEAELHELWLRSGLPGVYTVEWPAHMDERHEQNERSYAQVQPELPPTFELASATCWLPDDNRVALLAHEIGHVVAYRTDPHHSEDDADRAAFQATGIKIAYDPRWPGKGLQTIAGGTMHPLRNPILADGYDSSTAELESVPDDKWLKGNRRKLALAMAQELGEMTAKEVAAEAGIRSVSSARKLLKDMVKAGYATVENETRGIDKTGRKLYAVTEAGRELGNWIAWREEGAGQGDLTFEQLAEADIAALQGVDPWDWRVERDVQLNFELAGGGPDGPLEVFAIDRQSGDEVGSVQVYPSWSRQGYDARAFGEFGPSPRSEYAMVKYLRVHPAFRRAGVATQLMEIAARETAKAYKVPLLSTDNRTPGEAAWWTRQVRKGRAKKQRHRSKKHPEAARYALNYPPPKVLSNPSGDERMREIERAAAAGDPEAQAYLDQLAQERHGASSYAAMGLGVGRRLRPTSAGISASDQQGRGATLDPDKVYEIVEQSSWGTFYLKPVTRRGTVSKRPLTLQLFEGQLSDLLNLGEIRFVDDEAATPRAPRDPSTTSPQERAALSRVVAEAVAPTYFPTAGEGFGRVFEALASVGFEPAEVLTDVRLDPEGPPSWHSLRLARKTADPFSPQEVEDVQLVLTFYPMQSGNVEVIGYTTRSNPDAAHRAAAREGDPESQAQAIAHAVRTGQLAPYRVEFAAALGDPAALLIHPNKRQVATLRIGEGVLSEVTRLLSASTIMLPEFTGSPVRVEHTVMTLVTANVASLLPQGISADPNLLEACRAAVVAYHGERNSDFDLITDSVQMQNQVFDALIQGQRVSHVLTEFRVNNDLDSLLAFVIAVGSEASMQANVINTVAEAGVGVPAVRQLFADLLLWRRSFLDIPGLGQSVLPNPFGMTWPEIGAKVVGWTATGAVADLVISNINRLITDPIADTAEKAIRGGSRHVFGF